ncbi:Ku protein [Arthrobacter sp. JSM 101049]|uniref:non-homologous end joining protein Ku n=1 Tax=Arthrobacter sp. JSM 101049 TaxID=929097 RepID=UPI003569FF3A
MRAIWTGAVAFGLVNVPVKAYGAIEDHDVDLHQVHDADGGRIRYQRRCEVCGKKVDFDHIDKAYEEGERTVVLTDEDMESLPSEKSREIEVVQFVPNEQIDPMMLERSYYLEPDSKSPKAYTLLRQTLEDTERTAVVKFALRQKTRLGLLRVRDKVLVLQAMLWADEVREVDFPATKTTTKISDKELKMSAALVDQFSDDFTPEEFEDEYQVELRTLIDEKLKQGDTLDTDATFGDREAAQEEAGSGSGDVIDLMEALKRSVETKRSTSGKAAAKKPAAKKPASKKPATKKPAAKKAAKKDDAAPDKASSRKSGPKKKTTEKKSTARKSTAKKPASQESGARTAAKKGA